jgi:hypothetical protein
MTYFLIRFLCVHRYRSCSRKGQEVPNTQRVREKLLVTDTCIAIAFKFFQSSHHFSRLLFLVQIDLLGTSRALISPKSKKSRFHRSSCLSLARAVRPPNRSPWILADAWHILGATLIYEFWQGCCCCSPIFLRASSFWRFLRNSQQNLDSFSLV